MGRASLEGMLEVGIAEVDVMRWHLGANHYPPMRAEADPIALAALDAVCFGEGDEVLILPNGASKTATQIVLDLRLEPFVTARRRGCE